MLFKKAVIKDLEFPVAFEPSLKEIMAAASGLSCGSKTKGFGQKYNPNGYSLGPKIPLQITPKFFTTHTSRAAHCKAKVLCRIPFYPNPSDLQPLPYSPDPLKTKSFRFLAGKQHLQAPEDRIRNKS